MTYDPFDPVIGDGELRPVPAVPVPRAEARCGWKANPSIVTFPRDNANMTDAALVEKPAAGE